MAGYQLRYAVAAICVPLTFASSTRPGAIINMTQTEYEQGRWMNELFLVSVVNHKTAVVGSCKVVFNPILHDRTQKFKEVLRPVIVAERGDIPNFFVLPAWVEVN